MPRPPPPPRPQSPQPTAKLPVRPDGRPGVATGALDGRTRAAARARQQRGVSLFYVVAGICVLYFGRDLLIPVALAVLAMFLLAPLVTWVERWRLPRAVAVVLVVGLAAGMVGGLGWVIKDQVVEFAARLPEYKGSLNKKFESMRPSERGVIARVQRAIMELEREVAGVAPAGEPARPSGSEPPPAGSDASKAVPVRVVPGPSSPGVYIRELVAPTLRPLAIAGVVMIFTFFMLLQREDLRGRFIRLVGEREIHMMTPALDDAADRVGRYLRMQLLANSAVGVATGVVLAVFGVPAAAMWGLLVALLRFIPYVGIWIAVAVPLTICLAQSPGWGQPLAALGLILVIDLTSANVVEPLVFREGTGLSPLAIVAAAVFWTWLWGPIGLLLAIPLTVCLAVVGRHVESLEFLEVLLGNEPALPPDVQLYQRLLAGDVEEAGKILRVFGKEKELVEVYDGLVIPALRLVETGRHRGLVEAEQAAAIHEMLAVVVADAGDGELPAAVGGAEAGDKREGVVCLPARDAADELAGRMLAQLLERAGVNAEALSADLLTSEQLEHVQRRGAALVVVSAVPPRASVHARLLCRRLASRAEGVAIAVGYWEGEGQEEAARGELGDVGAPHVFTSLRQAVQHARSVVGSGPDGKVVISSVESDKGPPVEAVER